MLSTISIVAVIIFTDPIAENAKAPEVAPPSTYSEQIRVALNATAAQRCKADEAGVKKILPKNGVKPVVNFWVNSTGNVTALSLPILNKENRLDDLARTLVLLAEPFAPPEPSLLDSNSEMECLARWDMGLERGKPVIGAAVACFPAGRQIAEVAGLSRQMEDDKDPGAQLFIGFTAEAKGNLEGATKAYRRALNAAPNWDLAGRALGLSLVKAKKIPQAIPFLNLYVTRRDGAKDAAEFGREIERFKQVMEARLAEANRVRDRLSKEDIALGVRKGYPLLEPCLRQARKERALNVGLDTLQLTWKIRKNGTVESPRLDGPPGLLMTDHAECIEKMMARWRFAKYSAGSEITVTRVPIKVRGSSAAAPVVASETAIEAPASEPVDEPAFAQCERSGDEIQGYLQSRQNKLEACILTERRRAPRAPMPDGLPIAFVVDSDGPIREVAVDHRAYREGPLFECVATALSGALLPSGGSDCPAETNLDLRRLALPMR